MMRSLGMIFVVSFCCWSCNQTPQGMSNTLATQTTNGPTTQTIGEQEKLNVETQTFIETETAKRITDEKYLSENLAKAKLVVDAIARGKIEANVEGVAILPQEYQRLSNDGKIFMTAVKGKAMAILFLDWIGKGSNLDGYLFYSGSLDSLGRRNEYDDSMTIRNSWPKA